MMQPITTLYNGYRFRSRLEARWAVFFDAMEIAYRYEPEGFDLGDGVRYLPDFWLPSLRWWVEIKPEAPDDRDRTKHVKFSCALAKQQSEMDTQWMGRHGGWQAAIESGGTPPDAGQFVVFIGTPGEALARLHHGASPIADCDMAECALCHRLIATRIAGSSREASGEDWDMYHCEWCDTRDRLAFGTTGYRAYFHKGDIAAGFDVRRSPRLLTAYATARQARFEYGETPRVTR